MKNELERQTDLKQAAYISARNAIVKKLGKDVSNEAVLDVIMLMAHLVLTDNYTLPAAIALHNTEFFSVELKNLVSESQKDIKPTTCGRMM